MGLTLQFLGATGTVTGSKYLLGDGSSRLLVDCGLFQGYKQLRLRNWAPLPVRPCDIAAVVLTHAHIDHSGYLPLLVKNGFTGQVYCSHATRDLCEILLPDSGYLQEEEARYANERGYSKHHPALPLYTRDDAERSLPLFKAVDFSTSQRIGGMEFSLIPNGHILGSSSVSIAVSGRTIVFSGDLGRYNDAIMRDPTAVESADYLLVESTYGDRLHARVEARSIFGDILNRTFKRGGVVVIPAFAVGRTQTLLYYISALKAEGTIPASVPVYLNSPMAIDATRIFRRYAREHRLGPAACDAMCRGVQMVNGIEESERLNTLDGPMIIVSASGMATGGRVLHHIRAFAPDPRNTILFAGYQAGGTRGAAMVAGAESVKIHGNYVPIRAEVANLDMLSAHADYEDIINWLSRFTRAPSAAYITHGEPAAADALRIRLQERLGWTCSVPEYRETVELV